MSKRTNRLRFLFPQLDVEPVNVETMRRQIFVTINCFVTAPVLLIMAWSFLHTNVWIMPFVLCSVATLFIAVFVLVRQGADEHGLIRLSLAFSLFLATLPVLLGGGPNQLFYLNMFPLLAVFVFSLREGTIWSIAILSILLTLISSDLVLDSHDFEGIRVDFAVAYLMVFVFSWGFEALRIRSECLAVPSEPLHEGVLGLNYAKPGGEQTTTSNQIMSETFKVQRPIHRLDAIKFSKGVAQEFFSLLAIIRGSLQLIKQQANIEFDREKVPGKIVAAEQASDLTSKLLSFSYQHDPIIEKVDLQHVLDGYCHVIQNAVGENISFSVTKPEDLWACQTDQGQLESALLNLSLNARDAIKGKGNLSIIASNVKIRFDIELPPGDYVKISVLDDGEGMPKSVIDRVIEPFFSTKPRGEASGLGLSMIYGFLIQSGGKLEIESAQGLGTNVTIFLPRAVTQDT